MKYVKVHDIVWDENFQCQVDDEVAAKIPHGAAEISETPFPNLPIKSRFRSERHPESQEKAGA